MRSRRAFVRSPAWRVSHAHSSIISIQLVGSIRARAVAEQLSPHHGRRATARAGAALGGAASSWEADLRVGEGGGAR